MDKNHTERTQRTQFVETSLVPKSLLDQLDRIEEQIDLLKAAHTKRIQEFTAIGCFAHVPMSIEYVNANAEKNRLERAIVEFVRGRKQHAA